MLKKSLQLGLVLFFIGSGAFAQWEGSNTVNGPIWRNDVIGIGSSLYNGHITFGAMGTHLSIGKPEYPNQVILKTGWMPGVGDFTELRVPGTELNNIASLKMFHNGNVGIGTLETHEKFQIGTKFLFHDGGSKKICYNTYYDPNSGAIKRVDNAPIAEMEFTADGTIRFGVAPAGAANSIVDNYRSAIVIANSGNVGVGTNDPGSFKLAVEGAMAARSVKVTSTAFADYVFEPTYKLRPLSTVESYINENKHLPGMPSAKEVEKEGGFELAAMNVKLLEKIEELTLYVIEIKKENEQMKKDNAQMKKAINDLKRKKN